MHKQLELLRSNEHDQLDLNHTNFLGSGRTWPDLTWHDLNWTPRGLPDRTWPINLSLLSKILCSGTSRDKMNFYSSWFRTSFSVSKGPFSVLEILSRFRTSFSAMSHFVLRDRTGCQKLIPSHPASCPRFWQAVVACPSPWQYFELVLLSLCPSTMKEFLSICP